MKIKYLILSCLLLFNKSFIRAQGQLTAIDSLFATSIDLFYENAENIKSEIWEGMQIGPVCLFRMDGPALLYNHPNPPANFVRFSDKLYIGEQGDLELFGATQKEINGTLTAINNYDEVRYSSKEEAYAELFHELHHVYQRNYVSQIDFDNPAVLLTYPENYVNDGLKLYEQKLLFSLCFEQDSIKFQHLLNQFYSCRLRREQIIGTYLQYEESVENMEGPAFYCEYKFYNQNKSISELLKNNYNQKHFFGNLITPFYGRDNLRNRHLASGMAMCIILDKRYKNWQREYYSQGESLFSFFISKLKPKKEDVEIDSTYFKLSEFHTSQETLQHQYSFNEFNTQQGIKVTLIFNDPPNFKGFDPMHAESINDSTILHSTMLNLSGSAQNNLFIVNNEVITIVDEEIWSVKKVIVFASNEKIWIKSDKISINDVGKSIFWSGILVQKTENEIVFICN
ncbi:MAG TPA: hypothetical protein VEP89_03360 [Draconibacterium sp.]|nr:hypothetical protein [Draconibacterium sp.]